MEETKTTHSLSGIVKTEEQDLCILMQQTWKTEKFSKHPTAPPSKFVLTKLSKDIPEPVDNEHSGRGKRL